MESEDLLAPLCASGVSADGFEIDLGQADGPRRLFRLAREMFLVESRFSSIMQRIRHGRISREWPQKTWISTIGVDLRTVILLCQEFVKGYTRGDVGRIINLTSGQGLSPMPNELAYAATKGGVEAFTLSLSAAVA